MELAGKTAGHKLRWDTMKKRFWRSQRREGSEGKLMDESLEEVCCRASDSCSPQRHGRPVFRPGQVR